jgi:hypothetical protein
MPLAVYRASSKTALQPWKALGISKSAWQPPQRALPEDRRWKRPTRPAHPQRPAQVSSERDPNGLPHGFVAGPRILNRPFSEQAR